MAMLTFAALIVVATSSHFMAPVFSRRLCRTFRASCTLAATAFFCRVHSYHLSMAYHPMCYRSEVDNLFIIYDSVNVCYIITRLQRNAIGTFFWSMSDQNQRAISVLLLISLELAAYVFQTTKKCSCIRRLWNHMLC